MEFSSEEARLRHPLASLFPEQIWNDCFGMISDLELLLMEKNTEELNDFLFGIEGQDIVSHWTENTKKRAFLAVFYGHTPCSDTELLQFTQGLDLSFTALLSCSVHVGKMSLFENIMDIEKQQPQPPDAINTAQLFYLATHYGHISIVNHLIEGMASENVQRMIAEHGYLTFLDAATNDHINIINRLIELMTPDNVQKLIWSINYGKAFQVAVRNAHLHIVIRLVELLPSNLKNLYLDQNDYIIFRYAAEKGSLPVLNYLIELLEPEKINHMIKSCHYGVFTAAV